MALSRPRTTEHSFRTDRQPRRPVSAPALEVLQSLSSRSQQGIRRIMAERSFAAAQRSQQLNTIVDRLTDQERQDFYGIYRGQMPPSRPFAVIDEELHRAGHDAMLAKYLPKLKQLRTFTCLLVNWGPFASLAVPTFLIYVQSQEDEDRIKELVPATPDAFPVLFQRGCMQLYAPVPDHTDVVVESTRVSKDGVAYPGNSIGTFSFQGTSPTTFGTLGLYLEDTRDGQVYAITCAHVVHEGRMAVCPADSDKRDVETQYRRRTSTYEACLEQAITRSNVSIEIKEHMLSRLGATRSILEGLERQPPFLGFVCHEQWKATPYMVVDGELAYQYLDYALIRVKRARLPAFQNVIGAWQCCQGFVDPRTGMMVDLVGRSSGYTCGVVSAYPTHSQVDYMKDGKRIEQLIRVGTCISTSQRAFALPGDSGAAILELETGKAVGLLISGLAQTGITSFTPFREILQDAARVGYNLRPVGSE